MISNDERRDGNDNVSDGHVAVGRPGKCGGGRVIFERNHVCDKTPKGSYCTVIGDESFVNVNIGDFVLTRGGFCRSIDAAVRFEAEFCPWCGNRIREVAE